MSKLLTFKKNNSPPGSIIRCDISIFTGNPSLYQVIVGVGLPTLWQLSVVGSIRFTITSCGCSVIRGASSAANREKIKENFYFLYYISYVMSYKNFLLHPLFIRQFSRKLSPAHICKKKHFLMQFITMHVIVCQCNVLHFTFRISCNNVSKMASFDKRWKRNSVKLILLDD